MLLLLQNPILLNQLGLDWLSRARQVSRSADVFRKNRLLSLFQSSLFACQSDYSPPFQIPFGIDVLLAFFFQISRGRHG